MSKCFDTVQYMTNVFAVDLSANSVKSFEISLGTLKALWFNELGWETLYSRRWYRRLCHFFFNLKNKQFPEYLFNEIPAERQTCYSLRNQRMYSPRIGKTVRFSNTYFFNAPNEWNLLDSDIRCSKSIAEFKRRLLSKIRPIENCVYNIYDIEVLES